MSVMKDYYFGETWTFLGTATDYTGEAVPLSGAELEFHLSVGDEVLLSMRLGDDPEVSVVSMSGGQYQVLVPPSRQVNLPRDVRVYKIEIRVITAIADISATVSRRIRVGSSTFS